MLFPPHSAALFSSATNVFTAVATGRGAHACPHGLSNGCPCCWSWGLPRTVLKRQHAAAATVESLGFDIGVWLSWGIWIVW